MSAVLKKLAAAGLTLPEPLKMPPNVVLPFPWVHVRGSRILVSGHGPQEADGSLAGPFGKVGAEVDVDAGRELARKTALGMLGSLQRELGDLDRIAGWVRVFGMVNSAPGFDRQPAVINGFSELILELSARRSGGMPAPPSAWPPCPSAWRSRSRRNWNWPTRRAEDVMSTTLIHRLVHDYEVVHTALGILGNLLFVIGSVLFFETFKNLHTLAVALFVAGSLLMLVGALGAGLKKCWRYFERGDTG